MNTLYNYLQGYMQVTKNSQDCLWLQLLVWYVLGTNTVSVGLSTAPQS